MYTIDKQEFGAFVARLRKERGFTQKELAQRLFISDKAVSKWETGVSIPDTALLIPLSELLGVTVTELLLCRPMEQDNAMDAGQVERIVKTAIAYSDEEQTRAYRSGGKWKLAYPLALLLSCIGLILAYIMGRFPGDLITVPLLGAIFGIYFYFCVKTRLPAYYDENRISAYADGVFRMNIPGLTFNNSNWPHVVNVGRIWSLASMAGYPFLYLLMTGLLPELWQKTGLYVTLGLTLGGLFIPMYIVGKKYE